MKQLAKSHAVHAKNTPVPQSAGIVRDAIENVVGSLEQVAEDMRVVSATVHLCNSWGSSQLDHLHTPSGHVQI